MQHIRKPGVALSIRRRMLDLIADMSCQSWASLGLETLGHNEYEREFDIAAFRQTQERPGSHANRTYHGGVVYLMFEGCTYTCLYTNGYTLAAA
jgi:hypothetical protein